MTGAATRPDPGQRRRRTSPLFAKVYDVDQAGNATLPFQLVAPVRVTGAAAGPDRSTVTLPAIDYQFAAGHRLRLVLTTTDFGYATVARPPAAYRVALAGARPRRCPCGPARCRSAGGGVPPWWAWAAAARRALARGGGAS